MSNAELVKVEIVEDEKQLQTLSILAGKLAQSKMFPAIRTGEEALAVILMGRAIGIPEVVALNEIVPIQGRLTISAKVKLAKFQERGGRIKVIEWTDKVCTIELRKDTYDPMTYTYTMEHAAKERLAEKDNWKKNPRTMLYWAATRNGIQAFDPMTVMGLVDPDEIAADLPPASPVPEIKTEELKKPDPKPAQAEVVETKPVEPPAPAPAADPIPTKGNPAVEDPAPPAEPRKPALKPKAGKKPTPAQPAPGDVAAPEAPPSREELFQSKAVLIESKIALLEKEYGRPSSEVFKKAKANAEAKFKTEFPDFPSMPDTQIDGQGPTPSDWVLMLLDHSIEFYEGEKKRGAL